MNLFSEMLAQFKGHTVRTYIYHKLYGKQQLTIRNFQPLCAEDRIGFVLNDYEIFIYREEIENFHLEKKSIEINGKMQKIVVKIIE